LSLPLIKRKSFSFSLENNLFSGRCVDLVSFSSSLIVFLILDSQHEVTLFLSFVYLEWNFRYWLQSQQGDTNSPSLVIMTTVFNLDKETKGMVCCPGVKVL
jgi:hypothetical protein